MQRIWFHKTVGQLGKVKPFLHLDSVDQANKDSLIVFDPRHVQFALDHLASSEVPTPEPGDAVPETIEDAELQPCPQPSWLTP